MPLYVKLEKFLIVISLMQTTSIVMCYTPCIKCGLGIWKEDWNSITNIINDKIEIETYFVFFTSW